MAGIDFFYFFGSVYSYLSVMRIGPLAERAGVTVRWRPINVRPLMAENNVALRNEERKVRYMWRDIERRAAEHGVPWVKPPIWPTDPDLLANLVGRVAAEEGWIQDYTLASFRAWVLGGEPLGTEASVGQLLAALGQDEARVLALARSDATAAAYAAETDVARRHGVFGAPSFVVGQELFWGDDRLDAAVAWAAGVHPAQKGIGYAG
jgi:2-hydroxychromene-2-carboxylate isomerase